MTAKANTKVIDTQAELQHAANTKKQWIQACKLLNGLTEKDEPEAGQYFERITDMIEDKYGKLWLKSVLTKFDEAHLNEKLYLEKCNELSK